MSLIDPIGIPKGRADRFVIDGVADGYEAFALATLAAEIGGEGPIVFVARDGQRLPAIADALAFAAPELPVLAIRRTDQVGHRDGTSIRRRKVRGGDADVLDVAARDPELAGEELVVHVGRRWRC